MFDNMDYDKLNKIFEETDNTPEDLISILQKIQGIYGFLPEEAIFVTSKKLGIPPAKIMGVATFYSQFRLEPMGKYLIMICGGTACHVSGSAKVSEAVSDYLGIESGKTTEDGLFTLEKVACLGCCSIAPVMMINGEAFGNLDPEKAVSIIKNLREKEGEQ